MDREDGASSLRPHRSRLNRQEDVVDRLFEEMLVDEALFALVCQRERGTEELGSNAGRGVPSPRNGDQLFFEVIAANEPTFWETFREEHFGQVSLTVSRERATVNVLWILLDLVNAL